MKDMTSQKSGTTQATRAVRHTSISRNIRRLHLHSSFELSKIRSHGHWQKDQRRLCALSAWVWNMSRVSAFAVCGLESCSPEKVNWNVKVCSRRGSSRLWIHEMSRGRSRRSCLRCLPLYVFLLLVNIVKLHRGLLRENQNEKTFSIHLENPQTCHGIPMGDS